MELDDLQPQIAEILRRQPLMAFSICTAGHAKYLCQLGEAIVAKSAA